MPPKSIALTSPPAAMLPMGGGDWAMVVPAAIDRELGAAILDVVWDLKVSCN